jgi:hypothetical protein
VDQDKTNFENLCEVALLYLGGAAIKWLETEYGTNFATGTEVDPVKLLSIPDFANARNNNWNCATQRRPRCKEANLPHSPHRRPQADVWKHSGRCTQAAVVARVWARGFAHPGRSAQRRSAALAWINPRFFPPSFSLPTAAAWPARSERVGGRGGNPARLDA